MGDSCGVVSDLGRVEAGSQSERNAFFLSRRGELINEDWPRRVFAKVLKRAGLPWHTPYDLRHTFATLHLAKGHPITYVSAQLGHSDPSTTLRWYAHWLPTSDKRFADAMDSPPGQSRRMKS
jgi:integrase